MNDPQQLPLNYGSGALASLSPERIFEIATVDLLMRCREDRRVEWKPAGVQPRFLGEYISMFANSPGGGILVVGLEDDGTPSGCARLSQSSLNDIEQCGSIFAPQATLKSKRVPFSDGTRDSNFLLVFLIEYHQTRVVETSSGEAFVRHGASKMRLREHEKRNLQQDKGEVDFEQELTGLGLKDLDPDAVEQFAVAVLAAFDTTHRSPAQVLQYRHLGAVKDGRFAANVAGTLLFAKDPLIEFPGCKIRFLRFDGEHEGSGSSLNVVKDFQAEGTIPKQIIRAANFIETQLREFSRLDDKSKFFKVPEYPRDAWYEALVNACVHRSYVLKNMPVFVKMFDDRLVVESPGGFPPTVTPENIYESHHPRNPHLMDALRFLDYVRCMNEGTRRMRISMTGMELPSPAFEQKGGDFSQVRVTLRNNIKQRRVWIDASASKIVGPEIAATLSENEHRAINYIAERGSINVTQLTRITDQGWNPCKKLLSTLVDRGILLREGNPRLERDGKARFVLANDAGARTCKAEAQE